MKPLHVGLLVLGAAVAGGLAVKMTQPQAFDTAHAAAAAVPVPPPVAPDVVPAVPPTTVLTNKVPVAVYREEVVYQDPKPQPTPKPRKLTFTPAPKTLPVKTAKVLEPSLPVPQPVPYQTTPEPPALKIVEHPVVEHQVVEHTIGTAVPDPVSTPAPVAPAPLQVTLKQGTQLAVRLDQAISSDHLSSGDTFQASLAEPLVVDGYIVAERGSHVSGRVADAQKARGISGTSALELSLSTIQTADGQKIAISTEPWARQGNSPRNQEAARIGGGAALGAVIGAIAGGGMGAAIGAGVGGIAGTGAAAAARGKPVSIASETVIRFRLASAVTITERPL